MNKANIESDDFDELLVWLKKMTKRMRMLYNLPEHGKEWGEILRTEEWAYRNVMKEIARIRRSKKTSAKC